MFNISNIIHFYNFLREGIYVGEKNHALNINWNSSIRILTNPPCFVSLSTVKEFIFRLYVTLFYRVTY